MPEFTTEKRITNVNNLLQEHISEGGRLELVITRDGHNYLDLRPSVEVEAALNNMTQPETLAVPA